jgi:hypothetical protein
MLISYRHSFIFFHVAKVAGTSIRHALDPYTVEPEYFKIKRPPKEINGRANKLYKMWDSVLSHATVMQTQKALPKEFNHFYKFAFVRNPWDWQVSMYHFILKEKENFSHEILCELGSFKNYLEWLLTEDKPYPKGATKLQKTMLIDKNGHIAVDKIGRFENLNADFNEITAHLGINASLPKLNHSLHRNYQDYYNDNTQKLVATYFEEDIDLFGYTFNGK